MVRHRLAALALCLVCGATACKQDAFTLVDTTVRGAGGAAVGVIPAFSRVQVRAVPFMDDGWLRVVDGPFTGEAREAQIGVLPLSTTTAWVASVAADLRLKQTTRRLGGCTPVTGLTVPSDDGPVFVVVEQGAPIGTLREKETTATKPGAEPFWALARSGLQGLRADDASAAAEAALTCDPTHVAAREVLAALIGTDDPARAADLLARRKAPLSPLPAVASGAVLTAGEVAFVVATDAQLRSGPGADAPVVAALPIGTSVRVLEVADGEAKVQSLAGDLVVELPDPFADVAEEDVDIVDDDDADAVADQQGDGAAVPGGTPKPPATPAAPVALNERKRPDPFAAAMRDVVRVGFVSTASLALVAPDVTRLEAEANALGATAEAVVVRQRALALEPGRDALRKALVDVALLANRPREAALALHTPPRHLGGSRIMAELTTLRGCIGDVRRATVVDGEDVLIDDVKGDLCVDFDPRPACLDRHCPDDYADEGCDCGEDSHDEEEADAGPERPAAVVEAEAQAARAREEAEAAEQAASLAREQAEAAEARIELVTAIEAKKERTAKLDERLPRGPFVRVSLRRLEALPAGTTLHLARLQIAQDCTERGEQVEDIEATFAPRPLPLPTPRPQGEFVVLFEATPGWTYALYRVAPGEPGPDSGELAERREARLAEVFVPDTDPDCSCTPWCWR